MFNCGLYGGSFNPLHLGHIYCIIRAANTCKKLIIAISEGKNRNEIDICVRYRWIYQLTKHIGNVKILTISDDAENKHQYDEQDWIRDAQRVTQFANENIDVVFCGNDYNENSFWKKCYPCAQLKVVERNEISSTQIRNNIYEHWDWLPSIVRPYFVKKVLIIGGESSGKSTLTINLANYYNTNYLEEVGREISEKSGTDLMMLSEDFTEILLKHKIREMEALQFSNRLLFEDTDSLTTLFYIEFLKDKNKEQNKRLAAAIAQLNSYDLILFLEPDVDFVQDGDRSEVIVADREKYSNRIKEIYNNHSFNFESINGDYQGRFEKSVYLINHLLKAGEINRNN